ncbi:cytochrome d ubiquinol oxidase subunit II [Methylophaga sp. OBS1]|uniref:cytochrome d ubiquinol oxidase subunit II n=1 Tax=Methylophaga sp. OBS1 TaxID=2991933 RepID=UPI002253C527|nr:cytochrome d ubiquinol oxidase subunit II [Methylophaga sp. OBS1]MCX4193073.1 cytochrome d ubiquinol oxidase subunit II [Methylophaga sp. OBS1]
MFDYETLKLIWWLLIGVLLIGFALTDGFDMGVGTLLPFLGRNDEERRIMLNTVGPHWEGNQVWLITAGGALFAAWPLVYAMAFSGFYLAMMLTLFALFLRPVGFDYRSKIDHPRWRRSWDWGLFIGSAVPPLIFGVAFGNLLLGVPFHFDDFMRPNYTGTFWHLLSPFALLCGITSLLMVIMHGAVWLQARTVDQLESRAAMVAKVSAGVLLICFGIAGVWVATGIEGYVVNSMPDAGSSFTPEMKQVSTETGAWLNNYVLYPWTMLAPGLALLAMLMVCLASHIGRAGLAFISSCVVLTGIILTAGFSLFPFVMPSSSDINSSLTMWDATSSKLTLEIMFWTAAIFVPLILGYSYWTYRRMWQRLDVQFIRDNQHSTY